MSLPDNLPKLPEAKERDNLFPMFLCPHIGCGQGVYLKTYHYHISGKCVEKEAEAELVPAPQQPAEGVPNASSRSIGDALGAALKLLEAYEPGDSRGVSDEFVALSMVLHDPHCQKAWEIIEGVLNREIPKHACEDNIVTIEAQPPLAPAGSGALSTLEKSLHEHFEAAQRVGELSWDDDVEYIKGVISNVIEDFRKSSPDSGPSLRVDTASPALLELLDYRPADEEGIAVFTSRQAIHEVAEETAAKDAVIKGLRNTIWRIRHRNECNTKSENDGFQWMPWLERECDDALANGPKQPSYSEVGPDKPGPMPRELMYQPDPETLTIIRNIPLRDGDWAVACAEPGHFLLVHPHEWGRPASHPAYSYFRKKDPPQIATPAQPATSEGGET